MLQTILWDVDGTLLDFLAAEAYGMNKCMREIGVTLTDQMLADYSAINLSWWEKLERGEVTQKEVLTGRLVELFGKYGIPPTDYDRFNRSYQLALGEAVFLQDDCLQLLQKLRSMGIKQYVVTNGSRVAQEAKLQKSGIGDLVDGVFISELVGAQKPKKEFFDAVREKTGYDPQSTAIVGDSLTSDMRGGNNAHLQCIWYNPKNKPSKQEIHIDAQIKQLWELLDLPLIRG